MQDFFDFMVTGQVSDGISRLGNGNIEVYVLIILTFLCRIFFGLRLAVLKQNLFSHVIFDFQASWHGNKFKYFNAVIFLVG